MKRELVKKTLDDFRTNRVRIFAWLNKNKNRVSEEIYKVDTNEFVYRVLSHFNGTTHLNRYLQGKTPIRRDLYNNYSHAELSWDWGALYLPEQKQSGELSCSKYSCLFFRPSMRKFLADQENIQEIMKEDSPLRTEYTSKVQKWVEDGQIYVFENIDGKINLRPDDEQSILEHYDGKYPFTRISERGYKINNFINIIGQDMIGQNIKQQNPEADSEYSVVEFVESRVERAIRGIKNFLRINKPSDDVSVSGYEIKEKQDTPTEKEQVEVNNDEKEF